MNLHYTVEKAFDDLEIAIAHAELYDITNAAAAERYAQLLDDVIGLRDGVKKESAPAVGATEAEKENTSVSSIQGDGGKVKNRLVIEECSDGYLSKIKADSLLGLIYLYRTAQDALTDAARKNGMSERKLKRSAEILAAAKVKEVTS